MLKNIPEIITSDLMKILMDMGHGDEIVIGDTNFPSNSLGKRVASAKGHGVPEVLEAILKFLPLDNFVEHPVALMETGPQIKGKPKVWKEYEKVIKNSDEKYKFSGFEMVERFEFYERTKRSYAVVATSETSLYACIILKKGVL